jgi:hypothetical protein
MMPARKKITAMCRMLISEVFDDILTEENSMSNVCKSAVVRQIVHCWRTDMPQDAPAVLVGANAVLPSTESSSSGER